jgi:hypothetical protein
MLSDLEPELTRVVEQDLILERSLSPERKKYRVSRYQYVLRHRNIGATATRSRNWSPTES